MVTTGAAAAQCPTRTRTLSPGLHFDLTIAARGVTAEKRKTPESTPCRRDSQPPADHHEMEEGLLACPLIVGLPCLELLRRNPHPRIPHRALIPEIPGSLPPITKSRHLEPLPRPSGRQTEWESRQKFHQLHHQQSTRCNCHADRSPSHGRKLAQPSESRSPGALGQSAGACSLAR
jgi:hypothetical protein